jgi:hypothetical protein
MDYVALLSFRPNVSAAERDAGLARRAQWEYPGSIKVLAEYWPMAPAPAVVSIFSTDDPEAVMELMFEWNDIFDIVIHPALSAEDGLRLGQQVFARLPRMQHAAAPASG